MNAYRQLQDLLAPASQVLVGEVIQHHPDHTATVQFLSGGLSRVSGDSVPVGARAYVRDGRIDGEAPGGEVVEIEV
jgi:hypothetical protein